MLATIGGKAATTVVLVLGALVNVVLGTPRWTLNDVGFGVADVVGMESTFLTDFKPSTLARINSADPRLSYIRTGAIGTPFGYYDDPDKLIGVIGLQNHSLALGATMRAVLLDGTGGYSLERLAPTSKTDNVGTWSGVVGDVDEDPSGTLDANKNSTSDATASVTYELADPANPPLAGTDLQLFRLAISYTAAISTFAVYLETGTGPFVDVLVYRAIPGADPIPPSGSVLLLPFDISTYDPDTVKVRVAISGNTGTFSVEAVDWLADEGPTSDAIVYDSLYAPATFDSVDAQFGGTVTGTSGVHPQQTAAVYPDAQVSGAVECIVFLRDPSNTAGYIDVGELWVGPRATLARDRDWGPTVGLKPLDSKGMTEGGQTRGVGRPGLRTWPIPLSFASKAEAYAIFGRAIRLGTLGLWWVDGSPDDATEGPHVRGMATLDNLSELAMALNLGGDYRSLTLQFLEAR